MKNAIFSKLLFWVCLGMLGLNSCATTMRISEEELTRVKTMSPPTGKALAYIVRPVFLGTIVTMRATCDNQSIGSTHGKQFIYTYVSPGKHKFASKAENEDELELIIEEGKTYFFEQVPQMGWLVAANKLLRLDDQKGKEKLAKCKLAKDCPAYNKQSAGITP